MWVKVTTLSFQCIYLYTKMYVVQSYIILVPWGHGVMKVANSAISEVSYSECNHCTHVHILKLAVLLHSKKRLSLFNSV